MIEAKLMAELDTLVPPPSQDAPHTPVKPPGSKPEPEVGSKPPVSKLTLHHINALQWPIFKEAELKNDTSNWRAFSNEEHVNVYRFKKEWCDGHRQQRCTEVSARWRIRNDPLQAIFQLDPRRKGLVQKITHFLDGPQRKGSTFKPPALSNAADKATAEKFETELQALYQKKKASLHVIEEELSRAQQGVAVRLFNLVRKPQLENDSSKPVLPYSIKPEDYVIQYPAATKSTTAAGSPSKRAKVTMTDSRYQQLLITAQSQWNELSGKLDAIYNKVQNFLYPEAAEEVPAAEERMDDGALPSVEDFQYDEPDEGDGQAEEDECDRTTSLVLKVMWALGCGRSEALDSSLISEFEMCAIDPDTIFAELHGREEPEAKLNSVEFFDVLVDLLDVGLITKGPAESEDGKVNLTVEGYNRVAKELGFQERVDASA